MSNTILKQGAGVLRMVLNHREQPGKTLKMLDKDTVLVILPLDKAFAHTAMRDGEEIEVPGIEVNMAFQQELRMETDGNASCTWDEP